jgi:lysophospholipase L1-like esterase
MRLGTIAAGALFLALSACSTESPKDDNTSGTGGTNASAGTTSMSGSAGRAQGGSGNAAMGGSSGSGAAPGGQGGSSGSTASPGGSAGVGGTAGTTSTGGTSGAGGTPPVGGMGQGGTPMNGGAAGTAGAPMAGTGGDAGGSAGSGATAGAGGSAGGGATHWVGTWATGPQTTETDNLPPSPGLANNTLRQITHVSIGGSQIRVRISNRYGKSAVTISAVHIAKSMSGATIDTATDKALAFSGMAGATIATGQEVWSDALDFTLDPLTNYAVTIVFGSQSGDVTGHPGSRTTSYIASGNHVSDATVSGSTTDHWYFLTGIDVMGPTTSQAIAILGDSITDGRGSTTNGNDRWPDQLAKRLQADAATKGVGVLNLGIGGNAVVSGGLGPTATARYDYDILGQSAVKWVIVLEGINDIGANASANSLTGAFQQFIDKAHAKNLLIYGIPVLPFAGSDYDSSAHQQVATQVNDWIRAAGHFDAVLPLDMVVGSGNPATLMGSYDSGDQLHLSPAGYKAMADAIDLMLFK